MELIDVKLPPPKEEKENKDTCCGCPSPSQDRWPYGLQLRFETEQVEKIPSLTEYKLGDKVIVMAEARVTDIRSNERYKDGKAQTDQTVEMQIEKINCEPLVKKPMEKMTPKEYRKARMGE